MSSSDLFRYYAIIHSSGKRRIRETVAGGRKRKSVQTSHVSFGCGRIGRLIGPSVTQSCQNLVDTLPLDYLYRTLALLSLIVIINLSEKLCLVGERKEWNEKKWNKSIKASHVFSEIAKKKENAIKWTSRNDDDEIHQQQIQKKLVKKWKNKNKINIIPKNIINMIENGTR